MHFFKTDPPEVHEEKEVCKQNGFSSALLHLHESRDSFGKLLNHNNYDRFPFKTVVFKLSVTLAFVTANEEPKERQ